MVAECLLPRQYLLLDFLDADRIRPPHWSPLVPREAVTEDVDDILVARPQRDPVAEELRTLVNEGLHTPFDDFLLGDIGAARDAEPRRLCSHDLFDFFVANGFALPRLILEEARARFLAVAPKLVQAVRDFGGTI